MNKEHAIGQRAAYIAVIAMKAKGYSVNTIIDACAEQIDLLNEFIDRDDLIPTISELSDKYNEVDGE